MNSLRSLKKKKATKMLVSEEEVRATRTELEKKTEKEYETFARAKRAIREKAHMKFLD